MQTRDDQNKETATPPAPSQPGSPMDINKRAENPNPRANENLPPGGATDQDPAHDVGAEITDGEDA